MFIENRRNVTTVTYLTKNNNEMRFTKWTCPPYLVDNIRDLDALYGILQNKRHERQQLEALQYEQTDQNRL